VANTETSHENLVKQQNSARWRNALSGVDLLHQAQGG
jgi:hypothetical protein